MIQKVTTLSEVQAYNNIKLETCVFVVLKSIVTVGQSGFFGRKIRMSCEKFISYPGYELVVGQILLLLQKSHGTAIAQRNRVRQSWNIGNIGNRKFGFWSWTKKISIIWYLMESDVLTVLTVNED